MTGFESAFHFDSLVWDWIIAVYLFLAGMSAGAVMIALYLRRKVIEGDPANNGILKAMAWLAPFGIISGLTILIFHLTKPLEFWKIMIYFNMNSVMSMGVILFQVYMIVLFIWIGILFRHQIINFAEGKLPSKLLDFVDGFLIKSGKYNNAIELFLGFLAVVLAAYTGFLLSALKTYPMLNNPVLPILFLFSSLSSGAAACLMFGILVFKESATSPSVSWVHSFERPVVLFELFVLVTFFTGLIFSGGQNEVAAWNAIGGGFWSNWFWFGVVLIGMLLPLTLNAVAPKETRHNGGYIFMVTTLSLVGVLMLRTFILYAGQMTVV
ncbi:cytochrome c nitrite reductase subunit NrfD [Vibrio europaeus]|uniref:cytochrome c nitrite reductase subunit NrfD n=1 Tax=Vibrio oreintalis group TaxID=1891919 RepID=UPI001EFE144C|nr:MULTISPECIES: cytochrome c nitrite reductase subunit NrfD [Vibrio oreintalis group]MCG9583202.1 cytochrome c nitrite reductase subunit NrfD [Vibrio tubiashii]MCG9616796.1 cytochrome c nitrite reductase subunit NrfD [Vibrio tubiashii]MCG9689317.1 cytochrome c nitrite reductase subunit NrfD [Vibrio tubiashii]MDC5803675.1 cytochrome c nitrite reductase subunit NrfD [Vibrio europaeus]MDC5822830.1 cytochrome c nitrite reductase subunit NrfD [Vibrio europaeus]